jgi:hypothetical protein
MSFDKELLLTFSVLNKVYEHPSIRFFRGLRDADSGYPTADPPVPPSVGTLENPRSANIPMLSTVVDPKICSFIYNGEARFMLPKIVTDESGHDGEDTTWSLLAAPTPPYGSWAVLARDIILQYPSRNGAPVATNPHGVAQARGFLHIVDYASLAIYTVGTDDLNGLADGSRYTLKIKPFDVAEAAKKAGNPLPEYAKGQAIISIKAPGGQRYVFVLFIVSEQDPNDPAKLVYGSSVLIRLKADKEGGLSYDGQVDVGRNAVEIIPVTTTAGVTHLLVPAMGGMQQDTTNERNSNICRILAFSDWSIDVPIPAIQGDLVGLGNYDIRALATPDRPDDGGVIYILTGIFNSNNYNGFNYKLYTTTVAQLIAAEELSLSDALKYEVIKEADVGQVISPDLDNPYGVYFWDILCETGDSAKNDRLYFFIGSAVLVTCAAAYRRPGNLSPPTSDVPGPVEGEGYVYFPLGVRDGRIGGYNIDSVDLSAETLRQYHAGVALKHSAKATQVSR